MKGNDHNVSCLFQQGFWSFVFDQSVPQKHQQHLESITFYRVADALFSAVAELFVLLRTISAARQLAYFNADNLPIAVFFAGSKL